MAEPVNATPQQPVLPPEPWYKSEVQWRAVIAVIAQLVSIVLRILGRYFEIGFSETDLQLVVADITQGVAIVFGLLAVIKRQQSVIQPLTLTKAEAEKRAPTAQIDPQTLEKKAA